MAPPLNVPETVNVLLVDDTPHNLITLEAVLAAPGLNLVHARSGRDALRCLLNQDFAAILLDVNMPDLDGFEAASLIRGRPRSAHTPIIFLTAYPGEAQLARGYALGAVDYMLTPVQPDVLRAKIAVFADLFRKTREVTRQAELLREAEEKLRLRAEEALRRADERLRLMIESVRDYAIFSIDEDGRVANWNSGAERLFSYTEHEIVGRPIETLLAPDPDSETTARPELLRAVSAGRSEEDRWCVRKDGSRFRGSQLLTPIRDSDDVLHGFTAIVRNVTEQRQAEEALRASAAQLREADRRKDEFLAVLSHELRNPLAAIASAVTVTETPGLESRAGWAKGVISRQVAHLTRLLDDLLDVSRITLDKIQLQLAPLDMCEVARRATESVRAFVDTQRQQLAVELSEDLPVNGDATRLEQVFANLLTNAAKYTPRGGRICIAARRDGGDAVVTVEDTGIGIDPSVLPKVFDLFAQIDRGSERSRDGLGIGLSLARKLVELHGGSIDAHSDGPGLGSRFTVRIPLVQHDHTSTKRQAQRRVAQRPSAASVLVVDDNADAAEALALILQRAGYVVTTVHDGQSALEIALERTPDVILLDLDLPLLDGYEVAAELRRASNHYRTRLIAVSGYGQEQDRRRTEASGFEHHLVKPIDHDLLLSLLASTPERRSPPPARGILGARAPGRFAG